MAKKNIIWRKNDIVSICISDNLYTIAQMFDSPIMCFYDITSNDGIWEKIDLVNIRTLFKIFVNNSINKDFIEKKVSNKDVFPITQHQDMYFIKPYNIMDGSHYKGNKNSFPFLGGKLIKYDYNLGAVRSPIIKEDLSLPEDVKIIEHYELTNMWNREEIRERLIRYFSNGINRDDLKYEVFPDLWYDREKYRPLTSRLPIPLR
jgi:hypothetical protein